MAITQIHTSEEWPRIMSRRRGRRARRQPASQCSKTRSTPQSERGGAPQRFWSLAIRHASPGVDSLANTSALGCRSASASAYAKTQPPHRPSLRAALAPCISAQPRQPQPSIAAKTQQAEPQQSIAAKPNAGRTQARAEHTQSKRWHSNAHITRPGNGQVTRLGPGPNRPGPDAGMTHHGEQGARRGLLGPDEPPARRPDEPQASRVEEPQTKRDRRARAQVGQTSSCPSEIDKPRAQAG